MIIRKIISGGQTGADQAALDVAIRFDIPHGGWIPANRRTEAGPLPEKYNMKELPEESYEVRTERNVVDSEGTLILSHGDLKGGSEYTARMARKHGRPWLHVDMNRLCVSSGTRMIRSWVTEKGIHILNVAGPRASEDPHIYEKTARVMETLFRPREAP
jgi:hypothetical protein